MGKLIIEGNSVYEVDEECLRRKEAEKKTGQRMNMNRKPIDRKEGKKQ